MNSVEIDAVLKDVMYLSRLNQFLKENNLTIENASKEDIYKFITKEEQGKTDYYTGQPIPVNYSAGLDKIGELIFKYRRVKSILELLMENDSI